MSDGRALRSWLQKLVLLVVATLPAAFHSQGASLDSSVIGMFPKNTQDFGYANLSKARELSWFPQFEAQMVPVSLFGVEQLLKSIQIQQTSPIDEVAWANVDSREGEAALSSSKGSADGNRQPVVVAIGNFDAARIQTFVDSKKIPSVQIGDYTLYPADTGPGANDVFFAVLDAQTMVVGSLEPLKRVLKTRDGEEENLLQNAPMMSLIEKENGEGIFWDVLDRSSAGSAIRRLVPGAASFSQSRDLIGKVSVLLITVKAVDDIELHFQAACDSPSNALVVSQLLQAGVLMRRYQLKDLNDSEIESLFDALRIAPDGNLVDIALELTNEQITNLIEHNIFVMRM